MRLGTQTGSFTNHLLAASTRGQPTPEIGMGATILSWTDRHAATIRSVEQYRGKLLVSVTRDRAIRTDSNGLSECQRYEYEPCSEAPREWFWFDGATWREASIDESTGRRKFRIARKGSGYGLAIGYRKSYCDPSF